MKVICKNDIMKPRGRREEYAWGCALLLACQPVMITGALGAGIYRLFRTIWRRASTVLTAPDGAQAGADSEQRAGVGYQRSGGAPIADACPIETGPSRR